MMVWRPLRMDQDVLSKSGCEKIGAGLSTINHDPIINSVSIFVKEFM